MKCWAYSSWGRVSNLKTRKREINKRGSFIKYTATLWVKNSFIILRLHAYSYRSNNCVDKNHFNCVKCFISPEFINNGHVYNDLNTVQIAIDVPIPTRICEYHSSNILVQNTLTRSDCFSRGLHVFGILYIKPSPICWQVFLNNNLKSHAQIANEYLFIQLYRCCVREAYQY